MKSQKPTNKPEPKQVTPETTKPEPKPVLYTCGPKTTKPGTFFANVQAMVATKPLTLAEIITGLQANHKVPEGKGLVPKSKKEHDMVIRVRTNYAANHGVLVAVPEAK